jgi:hypothetical protein
MVAEIRFGISTSCSQFLLVYVMTTRYCWKQISSWIRSSVAAPRLRYFQCCHRSRATGTSSFFFQVRRNGYRNERNAWNCLPKFSCISLRVLECYTRFIGGREDLEDDPRSGRSSFTRNLQLQAFLNWQSDIVDDLSSDGGSTKLFRIRKHPVTKIHEVKGWRVLCYIIT